MSDAINPFGPKVGLPLVETKLGDHDIQKETENQTSAKDNATTKPEMSIPSQVQKSGESQVASKPDESQPHDPSKAILEANVKFNAKAIEVTEGRAAELSRLPLEPKPPTISLSKSMRIKAILASNGMDSQQAGKALNQILEVVQK